MTKGEETRQFIIERSAPIFNTKGIAATAMSDIMEATKLSKGSLYVHFQNKDVLAKEAVDHNIGILKQKVMTAVNQHTDAKEQLFAYIDVFANPMKPPVTGGCPIVNFGSEADDTNAAVMEKVDALVNVSQQVISDLIKKGIKNGQFKKDWNSKEFALIMFAMIEGGIVISRSGGHNNPMKIICKNLKKMIEEQVL